MAPDRLSRLQRRILAWLVADAQRTRGTMAASPLDLVQALAHDKGNLSHSLANPAPSETFGVRHVHADFWQRRGRLLASRRTYGRDAAIKPNKRYLVEE
jgi:hypothetical protein